MALFLVIAAGILGSAIGSFLNVVVWRLPRNESLVLPASHCPRCGHTIRWFDNIPILSWLVLRGRCRDCAEPISARYPAVELATALAFAGVTTWMLLAQGPHTFSTLAGWILCLVAFLVLAAISIALGLIDLDVHRLPNPLVFFGYAAGAVLLTAVSLLEGEHGRLLSAAIGLAAMFVAYLVMALVYPGGMGFGDVKLAGVLGLYLGWLGFAELVVGAFSAFLLGGVFAVAMLIARKAGRKSGIPFGPWMLAGAWVGILAGKYIAAWYLALFGLT